MKHLFKSAALVTAASLLSSAQAHAAELITFQVTGTVQTTGTLVTTNPGDRPIIGPCQGSLCTVALEQVIPVNEIFSLPFASTGLYAFSIDNRSRRLGISGEFASSGLGSYAGLNLRVVSFQGTGGDGTFLTSGSTNNFQVFQLNPVPVPEPSTWSLLLIGFYAVGAVLRRPHRRKQQVAFT